MNYKFIITNFTKENMKKDNVVKDKSYKFALRIIELYKYLAHKKNEFVLSKQI